ncbi:uncharacterized protein LOC126976257 [Leptidea sinapis]|uniref:uncharacterized protein LOC126976257 n=1 Tax=Leptidea sinapis TaxID=189913 RepID=UPI0021C452FF|nr:uncharacterized protein LOC126976257 [Leptidea sinapis]
MLGGSAGGYTWTSTDDEFSDALSTPVTEKKDILSPLQNEKKPLINYLVDTIQNKLIPSDVSSELETEAYKAERKVHFQEFYRTLYPQAEVSPWYYCYNKFSVENELEGGPESPLSALNVYYMRDALGDRPQRQHEIHVLEKYAENCLYRDTALSVACFARCADVGRLRELASTVYHETAVASVMYAALLKCGVAGLKDHVYYSRPRDMALIALESKGPSSDHMEIVRHCIRSLCASSEARQLRDVGLDVNTLLYHADPDYRQELVYRLASCKQEVNGRMACRLAMKYGMDVVDVWVRHLTADPTLAHLTPSYVADFATIPHAHQRIVEVIWPQMAGANHPTLINYFTLLKNVDEKLPVFGLTPAEHIKILKKAKAASPDLNYKLLVEGPTEEEYTSHILHIIKPENAALLTKFLRTLPSTFKIPVPVNVIYTKWLIRYFFDASASNSTKKWMQRYRECVSYFSKLSQHDILAFLDAVCFSSEAIQLHRVPGATRSLMLMQGAEYCQQEHDSELNINKNDGSWSIACQQVSSWASFLDSFHSGAVRCVRDAVLPPHSDAWIELEMSHGDPERVLGAISGLVFTTNVTLPALESLLQCLNLQLEVPQLFQHIADNFVHDLDDTVTLVSRMTQYHKDGATFPDPLVELVLQKASHFGLPPHKQLPLLSLSQRTSHDTADLQKVAASTIDLIRTEWPDQQFAKHLTEEQISIEEERASLFNECVRACTGWRQRRALADVIHCWPLTRDQDGRSVQCAYIKRLIQAEDGHPDETRALLKLLLRKPLLTDEEVEWCVSDCEGTGSVTACWLLALSNVAHKHRLLLNVLDKHRKSMQSQMVDDELVSELLKQGLFVKLVSSPLYSSIVTYILSSEASGEPSTTYTVTRAVQELMNAGFLAEAGHLRLLSMGVPASLSGFTESVLYCKKFFK